MLGSLIAHGVSPELVILSDGAGQYDVLVHAACWIHAERPLARLIPYSEEHRAAIAKVRGQIWELYQDLKGIRQLPERSRRKDLEARFDALCAQRTGFPSIDGVLKGMSTHRAALLRVLEQPEVTAPVPPAADAAPKATKPPKAATTAISPVAARCLKERLVVARVKFLPSDGSSGRRVPCRRPPGSTPCND